MSEEATITCREVAGALGVHAEAIPAEWSKPDFAGRPSITFAQAREFGDHVRREKYKRETRELAFGSYVAERNKERGEKCDRAAEKALRELAERVPTIAPVPGYGRLVGTFPDPKVIAVREAVEDAGEEFDARHPQMDMGQWLLSRAGREFR